MLLNFSHTVEKLELTWFSLKLLVYFFFVFELFDGSNCDSVNFHVFKFNVKIKYKIFKNNMTFLFKNRKILIHDTYVYTCLLSFVLLSFKFYLEWLFTVVWHVVSYKETYNHNNLLTDVIIKISFDARLAGGP